MNFKPGDKVRVRQLRPMQLEHGSIMLGGVSLMPPMRGFCGQVLTIAKVMGKKVYHVEENPYYWSSEMFEGYAVEYGDEVEFSNIGDVWQKGKYLGYIDHKVREYPYMVLNSSGYCNSYKYMRPIQKDTVDITVEGKTITISRESAKALGLVKE